LHSTYINRKASPVFWAHAVVLLVEVLKLEGGGFDSLRDH
jgi:hypothetical protein